MGCSFHLQPEVASRLKRHNTTRPCKPDSSSSSNRYATKRMSMPYRQPASYSMAWVHSSRRVQFQINRTSRHDNRCLNNIGSGMGKNRERRGIEGQPLGTVKYCLSSATTPACTYHWKIPICPPSQPGGYRPDQTAILIHCTIW